MAFAAAFLLSVALARLLSPEQFGTYKQIFLIYGALYGVAQLGMAESLFYFLPRDSRNAGNHVVNALVVLGACGSVCVALLILAQSRIGEWLNNPSLSQYMPLLAAYLMSMLLSSVLEIAFISHKYYRWASYAYGLSDVSRAICLVIPVVLWHDLQKMLLGGIFFSILRLVLVAIYFGCDLHVPFRLDMELLRTQLAYALPLALATLVEMLQTNFHSFFVSHSFDAATFALYSVGCFHVPLIALVASPATNIMMVFMAENIREGRKEQNLILWHDTTRKLAMLFFPLVALLLVVAPILVLFLFGDQYAASAPIFQLWTLTILNAPFQTGGVLRVFAQTRFLLFINIVQLLIIGASIAWFIRSFGLYGAVLATILSLVVARILTLRRLRRCLETDILRLLPWRSLACICSISVGAAFVPIALYRTFAMQPLLFLVISIVTYGSTYVWLLLKFGLLTVGEKASLKCWIQQMARPLNRIAEPRRS